MRILRKRARKSTDLEEYIFLEPKNFSNSKKSKSYGARRLEKKWIFFTESFWNLGKS